MPVIPTAKALSDISDRARTIAASASERGVNDGVLSVTETEIPFEHDLHGNASRVIRDELRGGPIPSSMLPTSSDVWLPVASLPAGEVREAARFLSRRAGHSSELIFPADLRFADRLRAQSPEILAVLVNRF